MSEKELAGRGVGVDDGRGREDESLTEGGSYSIVGEALVEF